MNAKRLVANVTNDLGGANIFLFGSSRYLERPSDLDVLFVYDPIVVAPRNAYSQFRPIIDAIEEGTGLRVHPVILSKQEEEATNFMELVEPILLHAGRADTVD